MNQKTTLRTRMALGAVVALGACAALAATSSTAAATPCGTSTPATTTAYDSPSDGDYGLAPEISAMTITVDGSCNISITLSLDALLIYGDSHAIYVNTDGNIATGSPTLDGSDVAVLTIGRTGVDDNPVMETWNGSGWTVGAQLTPSANSWGFVTRIDTLGIADPTTITAQAGTVYRGLYGDYFDWIPDVGLPPIPLSVAFAAPAPPPPPAAPASAAPAAPSAACITAKSALGSVTATIINTQRLRAKAKTPAARKKANARLKALAARKRAATADVATACAA